jgi:hypothetical protein
VAAIGTRKLTLEIDGGDVTAQVSDVRIPSAESDSDFLSFADAAAGGARLYTLKFVAVQDTTTGTLWDQVWTHAGETVTGTVAPYGNETPTVSEPHFTISAIITEPDGDLLGGEANASSTARFTFEVEWELTAKPVKVTA